MSPSLWDIIHLLVDPDFASLLPHWCDMILDEILLSYALMRGERVLLHALVVNSLIA